VPMGNPEQPAGYTSKYIDVDFTPEYAFGFGLTYTICGYSNLHLSSQVLQGGQSITVSAEVANRGSREATETVQLYIHNLVASVVQPVRKLTGFQRVRLKPGERRIVSFTISAADLAFYDGHMRLVNEPGRVQVFIAPDAARGLSGEFALR
jgi:beta-glucosidase